MELKFGGKLEIGDPIIVSYGHGIDFGLFAGYGRGTIQYYLPGGIIYHAESAARKGTKPKFYKAYIRGDNMKYRVVKVTPDILFNEEDVMQYERAIEILKLENIIK
jgi:hypothetical protein